MHIGRDLTAAESAPLVLSILAGGDSSGYEIVGRVRELSGGQNAWADSMVYPLFHRLLRIGYLTAEWREVPGGNRRRYYALTEQGRSALGRGARSIGTSMTLGGMW
jgi:DNA-binding PadR family transcriptional regulator